MSFESKVGAAKTLGQIALGVGALYLGYQAFKFVKENKDKVNPLSDKNVANQAASEVSRTTARIFSDNVREEDTTGTLLFDAVDSVKSWFGFGEKAAEEERQREVARQIAAKTQEASDVGRETLVYEAPTGTYYAP